MNLKECRSFDGNQPQTEKLESALRIGSLDNELRSRLMPVNRIWPLREVREALQELPLDHSRATVLLEDIILSWVNDSAADADELTQFSDGINGMNSRAAGSSEQFQSPSSPRDGESLPHSPPPPPRR